MSSRRSGNTSSKTDSSSDLQDLLARLKAHAPVAERHVWLLNLLDWVRGPGQSVAASVGRVELFLDTLQARTGIATAQLQGQLLELELEGHVARLPGGLFQRMAVS